MALNLKNYLAHISACGPLTHGLRNEIGKARKRVPPRGLKRPYTHGSGRLAKLRGMMRKPAKREWRDDWERRKRKDTVPQQDPLVEERSHHPAYPASSGSDGLEAKGSGNGVWYLKDSENGCLKQRSHCPLLLTDARFGFIAHWPIKLHTNLLAGPFPPTIELTKHRL